MQCALGNSNFLLGMAVGGEEKQRIDFVSVCLWTNQTYPIHGLNEHVTKDGDNFHSGMKTTLIVANWHGNL